jgi:hypothetical protein
MANSTALSLNESNDEDVAVSVTTNVPVVGTQYNLTDMVVNAYLKTAPQTADTDPSTWKGSTTTGEITVTNALTGSLVVSIPASAVTTNMRWWRVDVVNADSKVKTAVYGAVTVTDL